MLRVAFCRQLVACLFFPPLIISVFLSLPVSTYPCVYVLWRMLSSSGNCSACPIHPSSSGSLFCSACPSHSLLSLLLHHSVPIAWHEKFKVKEIILAYCFRGFSPWLIGSVHFGRPLWRWGWATEAPTVWEMGKEECWCPTSFLDSPLSCGPQSTGGYHQRLGWVFLP